MKQYTIHQQHSLEKKLQVLIDGQDVTLTKAEAFIFGIEYSDSDPDQEEMKEVKDGKRNK